MRRRLFAAPVLLSAVIAFAPLAVSIASAADGTSTSYDPGPRFLASFTADASRNRMILFGGWNGTSLALSSYLNDTWQLDVSGVPQWTQVAAGGPPARMHAVFVHDPTRDRMVLFGGKTTGAVGTDLGDVWVFDLASNTWSPLFTSGSPPAPFATHGIYDPIRDRMVTFGGFRAGSGPTNEVWELTFSGTPTWNPITPAGTPPTPRHNLSVIYDPFGDRLIAFGGLSGGVRINEVWALSLSGTPTWTMLTPAGTPPAAREAHMSVYDPLRMRMIMFAGFTNSGFQNDTWALDLSGSGSWTQLVIDGPLPYRRDFAAYEYDIGEDRLVLYGGNTTGTLGSQEVLGDLHTVDIATIPTATQVSAAEPEAQPDRVLLRWHVSSAAQSYEVFRSEAGAVWERIGSRQPEASGVLTWDDRDVVAGHSYSYRLRFADDGAMRFGGELSVTVPREFALALRAPDLVTADAFQVEMTLPARGDTRLEVFDVSGRRVFEQSDARDAGRHTVSLGSKWTPGVYWVRLERAGTSVQRRVAILR